MWVFENPIENYIFFFYKARFSHRKNEFLYSTAAYVKPIWD